MQRHREIQTQIQTQTGNQIKHLPSFCYCSFCLALHFFVRRDVRVCACACVVCVCVCVCVHCVCVCVCVCVCCVCACMCVYVCHTHIQAACRVYVYARARVCVCVCVPYVYAHRHQIRCLISNDTRSSGRKFHACANVCIWTVMLHVAPLAMI
jgi:hypothetical protein